MPQQETASTLPSAPGQATWYIDGSVTTLRRWGTKDRIPLRDLISVRDRALVIGSSSSCQVQLHDESGQLSKRHATLIRTGDTWEIVDDGSLNGTWVDGERVLSRSLQAGERIRVGLGELVAGNDSFHALEDRVSLFVGFAPDKYADADEAQQSLRAFAHRKTRLYLLGDGNLVHTAEQLHRATLGPDVPFLVHEHGQDIQRTIDAAGQGTICVANARQDGEKFLACVPRAANSPRLILCRKTEVEYAAVSIKGEATAITIPPLSARSGEKSDIVAAITTAILRRHGFQDHKLTDYDLSHILECSFEDLLDLENTLNRLVLVRNLNASRAAKILKRNPSAISQWLQNWMRSGAATKL